MPLVRRRRTADGRRQAAALAGLAHITGGRTDPWTRYAGERLARYDTRPGDIAGERAVQLRLTGGADMGLIERWRREKPPSRRE